LSTLGARDDEIRRTERFIAYIRAAVIAFNIVTYLTLGEHGERHSAALAICVVAGAYSLLTLFGDPLRRLPPIASAVMTTVGDNILIALWVCATGGFSSPYFPLFYAEAAASIGRFGTKLGSLAAAASASAYALVLLIEGAPFFDSLVRVAYTGFIGAFVAFVVSVARGNEREMIEAKTRAETLEELDEMRTAFVSTVSHELRTPLTAVQGAASTLQRHGSAMSEADRQQMADILERQSSRLGALIEDMISLGLAEQGRLSFKTQMTDVTSLVKAEIQRFQGNSSQPVEVIPVVGRVEIRCDPVRIGEVLAKILSNASKFSPASAPITVAIENDATCVRIQVVDRGVGIAPEDQEKIFERFRQVDMSHTRSAEGAGIGLSIARAILKMHGGDVSVSSTPGQGATFTLVLPKEPATSLGNSKSA
jgi:signal transduction histidine kinase